MKAGSLRHRITIQQNTPVQDAAGQAIAAWTKLADVWAAVEPLAGRELQYAQQLVATATYRVRIRYRSDVTVAMRVLHGTRTMEINAIRNPDERNREMELLCTEIL